MYVRDYTRWCRRLAAALSSMLFATSAWALTVSPMSGELSLSTSDHYELTVVNDTDAATPIKIMAMSRAQDATGEEVRTATDDLVIFPHQVLLKPREQRMIRVSVRKKQVPKVEAAYRLIVEQIATKDGAERASGVRFVTRFVTAMYILPERPLAQVELVSAKREADGFAITLKNTGNTHAMMAKPSFKFRQSDILQTLDNPENLKPLSLTNLLPGSTHTITWHWPTAAPKPTLDLTRAYRVEISWDCPYCDKLRPSIDVKVD